MIYLNLREFLQETDEYARLFLPAEYKRFAEAVYLLSLALVVEYTPVREGYLRGSWILSRDINSTVDGPPDKFGEKTIARGEKALKVILRDPYQDAYLVNSQPYASIINYGTAEIEAVLMVERMMQRVQSMVQA